MYLVYIIFKSNVALIILNNFFSDKKCMLTYGFSCPSWHPSIWCFFSFIHSFMDSVSTSFTTLPYDTFCSMHFVIHTQFPGSLRQEVLQLQLSAKVSLKGNSSDLWPLPQGHVLLKAYPQALELFCTAFCRSPNEWSVPHWWLRLLQY